MKWSDIEPADATGIDCTKRPDLDPPRNENGDVCPWPWEPQQLKGVPLGQYHCGYCGAMCVAGVPHPDYRDLDLVIMRDIMRQAHELGTPHPAIDPRMGT